MNEEMKNALNSFVERMLETMEAGVDFASEQIPILLHEILYWGFAMSMIKFVTGIILLVVGIVLLKKAAGLYKEVKKSLDKAFEESGQDAKTFCRNRVDGDIANIAWKTKYRYDRFEVGAHDEGFFAAMSFFIPGLMTLTGIFVTIFNWTWLQILLAPRLYLLEYAAQLAR